MTKKFAVLLFLLLAASTLLCAQTPATTPTGDTTWPVRAAGAFSMAIASGLCGLAQAKAIASSAEGMARNPGASAAIRFALILGLILIESLALYTMVIVLKVS
ncbi:H+-transporting two-sector ATPase, C subunit [Candidatus Sulfopaludibacter sp. SbA3]|nr:H+-transporting two-sector ATPase, C subunit [Candidatus Sulfopaludibacter sp. SbA3]